jgi:inosine/xanthosine triphosphate pyrophosphatase family protein
LRGVQALSDFPGPLATSNGRHKSLNEKEGKNKILEEMNKKGETRVRKKFKILRPIIRLKWQV